MNKNILIVKLSAIGDVIHALPIGHALKQLYPQSRITWIVEKPAYDLLTNNPYIDEIMIFEKAKYKSFYGLLHHSHELSGILHSKHFDLAIDLQGLFKSAAISWLSGANERLVYCNARELSDWVGKRVCGEFSDRHIVDRYLDVVRHLGGNIQEPDFTIKITNEEAQLSHTIATKAGFDLNQAYVVLAPGTNWPNKCWPLPHFSTLSNKLTAMNVIPVIVGGPGDQRLAAEISANTTIPPVDLTGKTSLKQLAYIIQQAKAFVGGDTGPMHLAAALKTPTVAMFGPTDVNRNGPYGKNNIVLTVEHDCQGCWKRSCPLNKECLENITPDKVCEAVELLICGSSKG